ncbi:hypothetical protein HPB51_019754 [Rhipicephalus microplus]|uniref:THAP9-like helix-turn-helix domain-containing protein n=1 Tax=Rhipicephalus microplus TaxID=6941 RepID=A0A9J6F871_RHIMP|nr:hypothetical protein HPB51_019754 [Rhipicephalus microplus]
MDGVLGENSRITLDSRFGAHLRPLAADRFESIQHGCPQEAKLGCDVKQKRPDPKSRDFPAPPGPERSGLCDLPGAENFPEDSPTKQFYKDKVLSSQEEITQLKKKVKTLQQTKRRLVKRNETAQEIIREIRERKLLSEEGSHVFSSVFSDDIQQLLCRVGNEQKGKYPPELRAFALTLHFYSPAAYEYPSSPMS